MKTLLLRSIQPREKIMLFYMDEKRNVTQRLVRVIKIEDDKMVAYCFLRKQTRMFKLDHILSVGPVRGSEVS